MESKKDIRIAVVGLGYVGLPLARLFATKFPVIGFDINRARVEELQKGHDTTLEVEDEVLQAVLLKTYPLAVKRLKEERVLEFAGHDETENYNDVNSRPSTSLRTSSVVRSGSKTNDEENSSPFGGGREGAGLFLTINLGDIANCNHYIITVPTPVDKNNRPDLTPLYKSSESVGKVLKKGDIVIYESTVYPGVTEDECVPVLERVSELKFNEDFFVGYSPERINPFLELDLDGLKNENAVVYDVKGVLTEKADSKL